MSRVSRSRTNTTNNRTQTPSYYVRSRRSSTQLPGKQNPDAFHRRSPTQAMLPSLFYRTSLASTGAVKIGDIMHLFDDASGLVLGADGLLDSDVGLARPYAPPTLTSFYIVAATDGSPPDRMYVPPASSGGNHARKFGLDAAATLSASDSSGSGSRVDLELQRMAQWPRLLASYIEREGASRLRQSSLDRAMAQTLLSHPNILSMAVAFEPGVFFKEDAATQPEALFCRFVLRESPTSTSEGSNDDAIDEGSVSFADLLPPFYQPLYSTWPWYRNPKISGRAEWSPPYVDEGTPRPMLTYSVPMWRHGVFVGVATMDVLLDASSTAGQATLTDVESSLDLELAGIGRINASLDGTGGSIKYVEAVDGRAVRALVQSGEVAGVKADEDGDGGNLYRVDSVFESASPASASASASTSNSANAITNQQHSGSMISTAHPTAAVEAEGEGKGEGEGQDALRTAALAHLERLAAGPRRIAAQFAERLSEVSPSPVGLDSLVGDMHGLEQAVPVAGGRPVLPSATELEQAVTAVVLDEPLGFGSCIAFSPGVYHGYRLASFYTCVNDAAPVGRAQSTGRAQATVRTMGSMSAESSMSATEGSKILIDVTALDYDFTKDDWFKRPYRDRRDFWSQPYFDAGGGDIWMVTYSAPVLNAAGALLAVVTIDIRYNQQVKGWFREAEARVEDIQTCRCCGLPCPESFWIRGGERDGASHGTGGSISGSMTDTSGMYAASGGVAAFCDCCVDRGLVRALLQGVQGDIVSLARGGGDVGGQGIGGYVRGSDLGLVHVGSARWYEWRARTRKDKRTVRYGQIVQLRAVGSRLLLGTKIRSDNSGTSQGSSSSSIENSSMSTEKGCSPHLHSHLLSISNAAVERIIDESRTTVRRAKTYIYETDGDGVADAEVDYTGTKLVAAYKDADPNDLPLDELDAVDGAYGEGDKAKVQTQAAPTERQLQLRSMKALAVALHDPSLQGFGAAAGGERLHGTYPSRWTVRTESGADPYVEGSSDTWFVLECDGKVAGEEVAWGDQVRIVSYRWRSKLQVHLQPTGGADRIQESNGVASKTKDTRRRLTSVGGKHGGAFSDMGGLPFSQRVWYHVLRWVDRARGRVHKEAQPIPRALGIGVLAALRAGKSAFETETNMPGLARLVRRGTTAWRLVRSSGSDESPSSAGDDEGGMDMKMFMSPHYIRMHSSGSSVVAEHDEMHGATRRGKRAIDVRAVRPGLAEGGQSATARLDSVWQLHPWGGAISTSSHESLTPSDRVLVSLLHVASGRFARANDMHPAYLGDDSIRMSRQAIHAYATSLVTTPDIDRAAVFEVHVQGSRATIGGGLHTARVLLSKHDSVADLGSGNETPEDERAGADSDSWVAIGAGGMLHLEVDMEAAAEFDLARLDPSIGRTIRFWLSARDTLLGHSNMTQAIHRQRVSTCDPSLHRREQIRLLQGALASCLLIHEELASAEPTDPDRATVLSLQIAEALRAEAGEDVEGGAAIPSSGSTTWDAGTQSGGGSTRSEDSDGMLRAGEAKRARDFTREDDWWHAAIISREEEGPMNHQAFQHLGASDVVPVMLDLALFLQRSAQPVAGDQQHGDASMAVDSSVEYEVKRRVVAVAAHVCCISSQASKVAAAAVAPRIGEFMRALSANADPALGRMVAYLVATTLTVYPAAINGVTQQDVRSIIGLVLSYRRLSHRLLQLLASVCCQMHDATDGELVSVRGDCGASRLVGWTSNTVTNELLLAKTSRGPFVLELLSTDHAFWVEMAEARGDSGEGENLGTPGARHTSARDVQLDEHEMHGASKSGLPTDGELLGLADAVEVPVCSTPAMQSFLRLCHRLAIGISGRALRSVLRSAPMLQPTALLAMIQDESLPPSAFGVRCQLAHIFRTLHVEPSADYRHAMPRVLLNGSGKSPANGRDPNPASGAGGVDGVVDGSCRSSFFDEARTALVPTSPADVWTSGYISVVRGLGEWRNVPDLQVPNGVSIVCSGHSDARPIESTRSASTRFTGDSQIPTMPYRDLHDFFVSYLARCLPMATKNELTVSVLALLQGCLRTGACSIAEMAELVPFLGQILCAEQDRDGTTSSRMLFRRSYLHLHAMKVYVCRMLHSLVDLVLAASAAASPDGSKRSDSALDLDPAVLTAVAAVARAAYASSTNQSRLDVLRQLLDLELRLSSVQHDVEMTRQQACALREDMVTAHIRYWENLAEMQSLAAELQLSRVVENGATVAHLKGGSASLYRMQSLLYEADALLRGAMGETKLCVDVFAAMGGIETALSAVMAAPIRRGTNDVTGQPVEPSLSPPLAVAVSDAACLLVRTCLRFSDAPVYLCRGQLRSLIRRASAGASAGILPILVAVIKRSSISSGEIPESFVRFVCEEFLDCDGMAQLKLLQLMRALLAPGGSINAEHYMLIVRALTNSSTRRVAGSSPMQMLREMDDAGSLRETFKLVDGAGSTRTQARRVTLGVLRLLHEAAPNQLVYDAGKAIRRHEEAARLIQASVDWRGILVLLVSVGSFDYKTALLRFLEQIFGSVVANGYLDGASCIVSTNGGLLATESERERARARLKAVLGASEPRGRQGGASAQPLISGNVRHGATQLVRAPSFSMLVLPRPSPSGRQGIEQSRTTEGVSSSGYQAAAAAGGSGSQGSHSEVFIEVDQDVRPIPARTTGIGILLRDMAAAVELWCLEVLEASVHPTHGGIVDRAVLQGVGDQGSEVPPDVEKFVFGAALPFTVGYFHSSFTQSASLDLRIRVREYFNVLLAAAEIVLCGSQSLATATVGVLSDAVVVDAASEDSSFVSYSPFESRGGTERISIATILLKVQQSDSGAQGRLASRLGSLSRVDVMMLANALLHVVDPYGKYRASGAFAGLAEQEVAMLRTINRLRDSAKSFAPSSTQQSATGNAGTTIHASITSNLKAGTDEVPSHPHLAALRVSSTILAYYVGALDVVRLRQTVRLLQVDAAAGQAVDRRIRLQSWLGSRPRLVVSLLDALAGLSEVHGGQMKLVHAGCPRLVVDCIAAVGYVGGGSTGDESTADGKWQEVVEASERLGRSILMGGYRPAQEALLAAVQSSGRLMQVISKELSELPLTLRTKQDAAGNSALDYSMGLKQLSRWEGGLTLLQFLQECCEGQNRRFQDAFREQAGSSTQHDIVTSVVQLLSRMCIYAGPWWTVIVYWDAWYEHADLAVHAASLLQTMETLTEMLQGPNPANQAIACDSRLLETITWIMDAVRKAYFHCNVYTQAVPDNNDYGNWGSLSVHAREDGTGQTTASAPVPAEAYNMVGGRSRMDVLLQVQYAVMELVYALVEAGSPASASQVSSGIYLHVHGPFLLGRLGLATGILHGKGGDGRSFAGGNTGLLSGSAGRSLRQDAIRVSGLSFGDLPHRICAEDTLLKWLCTIRLLCVQIGLRGDLDQLSSAAAVARVRTSRIGKGIGVLNGLEQIEKRYGRSVFLEGFLERMDRDSVKYIHTGADSLLRLLADNRCVALVRATVGSIRQVDVVVDGRMQYIVFPLPPVVRRRYADQGWRAARDALLFEVDRSNLQAKVTDFTRRFDSMLDELCSFPTVRGSWLATSQPLWQAVAFVLVLLLHVSLLLSDSPFGSAAEDVFRTALLPLGIAHAAVSAVRLCSSASARGALWLDGEARDALTSTGDTLPEWQHPASSSRQQHSTSDLDSNDVAASGVRVVLASLITTGAIQDELYFILSVVAVASGAWQLFAYHLLFDLVRLNSLLYQTLSAIDAYRGSLAAVVLFFFALIYMFALIGQSLYKADYPDGACSTLFECVIFTVVQGGAGSGMGDILERDIGGTALSNVYIYERLGGGRAIFDVAFFLVIPLTMLSIISGIIIDAFGAQRDYFYAVREDQEAMSFVNGFKSSHFDRSARGFQYHIKHEQNMWDYVYLAAYLRLKETTAKNGLEARVSQLMHRQLTSYLPMGQARTGLASRETTDNSLVDRGSMYPDDDWKDGCKTFSEVDISLQRDYEGSCWGEIE